MADEIASLWSRYISESRYDDLPEDVRRTVRALVLDVFATTLAANTLGIGIPQLLAWARGAGGTPEATLLGFQDRVPVATAAMLNGGMAHALNFDDTTAVGSGHLGPLTVPLAMAAAELRGRTTGRHFMVSIAAGAELMSRMGVAITAEAKGTWTESRPQPTQMPGYLAAAATAARCLKLDPTETHSALGLAFMQASGGRQPVLEGRPAKAVYASFPCQGGMLSTVLARDGLLGDCDLFEGKAGFFNTYYGGVYHRAAMTEELGDRFYLLNVGIKPWPTTGVAHVFIEAASRLHAEGRVDPAEVTRVLLRGEPHIETFCEPLQTRRNPSAPVEGEDSIIFAAAKALTGGTVTLADLQPTPQGLFDERTLAISNVTDYQVDESLGKSGVVEVTLRSGETISQRVDHAPGHRDNPLTDQQRHQKFFDCAVHANAKLSDATLREIVDRVEHLDEVDDVRDFARLLGGG